MTVRKIVSSAEWLSLGSRARARPAASQKAWKPIFDMTWWWSEPKHVAKKDW